MKPTLFILLLTIIPFWGAAQNPNQPDLSKIYPCQNNPEARRFDFWVGEWEVYAKGKKAGENSITLAAGGCALHESYTTAGYYSGQSINFWDPYDGKWKQNWVGSSGDVMNFVEDDSYKADMQFIAKVKGPQGEEIWRRMSFSYDPDEGTVRQLIVDSKDEGKTWVINFDGMYKKKN